MRASCQGRSARCAPGLSARTPWARPRDNPTAIPTASIKMLPDFLLIGRQHTCAEGSPPAAVSTSRVHPQPDLGVHGFAPLAYFEVQLRDGAVGVAQGGDHIARRDPVADRLVENLGM